MYHATTHRTLHVVWKGINLLLSHLPFTSSTQAQNTISIVKTEIIYWHLTSSHAHVVVKTELIYLHLTSSHAHVSCSHTEHYNLWCQSELTYCTLIYPLFQVLGHRTQFCRENKTCILAFALFLCTCSMQPHREHYMILWCQSELAYSHLLVVSSTDTI